MDSIILREENGSSAVLYLDGLATKAEITQNEESEFSLKITVSLTADDPRYKFIKKGMIIEAKPDKWSNYDMFRIWGVKKKSKTIDIVAYHISYDMNGWIVIPFQGSKTYSEVMDWVARLDNPEDQNGVFGATADNFPFDIIAGDYSGTATAGLSYPMTLREYLIGNTGDDENKISVAQDFGGHFVFHGYTAEHSFSTYTHTVVINSHYHASDFSVEDRWENYYSAVFPYYVLNSSENPVRIVPGETDGATIIPTDSTPGAPIDYSRIYMLDVTDDFNGSKSVSKEDVIAAAEKWMTKNRMRKVGWKPPFEVDVNYVSIAQEKISVYDKVSILIPGESDEPFHKYIGETTYDLIKDRYTKLKFVDDNSNADNTVSGMLAGSFSNGNGSVGQNTIDAMSKNGGTGEVDGNSIIKVTRGDRTYLVSRGAVIGYWFGDSDSDGEKWYEDFECTKRIALESRTVMFNFGQVVGGQHVKRVAYPDVRITREFTPGTTIYQTEPLTRVTVKDNDVLYYDSSAGLYLEYTPPSASFTPSYLTKCHDPDGGYWLGVNISTLATDLVSSYGIVNTAALSSYATQTYVQNYLKTDHGLGFYSNGSGHLVVTKGNWDLTSMLDDSNVLPSDLFATRRWVNSLITDMATQTWVRNQEFVKLSELKEDILNVGSTEDFVEDGTHLNVNSSKWALKTWVQDNFVQKCLKAGTKIKMADGTDKNVEDVKPGDIVLSYDIQNDTTCEAVVLNMRQTGMAEAYAAMVFDNETYVEVYGEHDIFIDDRKRLECYQFMDSGEKAITTDGSRTTFVFRENINHNVKSRHYALVTSNHLYFANGILMGTRPNVTYEYASEVELPDELSSKLRSWAEYGKRSTETLLSPENLSAILELSRRKFSAHSKMEALGKNLKDTDHVSIKLGEGEIDGVSEEVDIDRVRQRRAWRAEVRIHEQEYAEAVEAIETYKREHDIPNELSNREKLLYANTEANAALDEFKEWAQSK